ncbi:uncharacterized protein LOC127801434 [Diospyros lotus]|uniref:uncharacterized protein LOC127801434 n=1 Tax=Diospyros lotus TaxID=55363 RepID=UPI00224E46C6|nr:uncharacterized protein LOC127801434 [Diospyros lotus]
MEAYMDNMIVKSFPDESHTKKLSQVFTVFRKYNMCLNPRRKNSQWNEECEKASQALKTFLKEIPLLTRFDTGEPLYLYLEVSHYVVNAVLIKKVDQTDRPVYYLSKVLQRTEARYLYTEKVALTLCSRRLSKWAIKLSEHGIHFEPRRAIKGKALTDFIVECTNALGLKHDPSRWILFMDGIMYAKGCRVGVVLISPKKEVLKYSLRSTFSISDNIVQYEALVAGINLAKKLKV